MSVDRLYEPARRQTPRSGAIRAGPAPREGTGFRTAPSSTPARRFAIPHATDVGPNSGSATADPGPTPNERNTRLPATGVGTVTPPPQQYAPPAGVRAQVRCAASCDVNDTFPATDAGMVCGTESCTPMPSWPVWLCPQQNAAPALVSPQV